MGLSFLATLWYLFLVYPTKVSTTSCSTNTVLSQTNQSSVARVIDSLDAAVFECNVTCEGGSQLPITWTLENFNKTTEEFFVRETSYPFISIDGGMRPSGLGTYRNRLTIQPFSQSLDGSVLRCSSSGNTAGIYYLNAYRPPQLTSATGSIDILENGNKSINLVPIGEPMAFPYPLTFTWTRDGKAVGNSSRVKLGYPEAVFTNVSRSDAGRYVLTATNYRLDDPSRIIGTAVGSFSLNVKYGPDLEFLEENQSVLGGWNQAVTFECGSAVHSNPPATVVWRDKDGLVDVTQDRFSQDSLLTLTVNHLMAGDMGTWTCVVTGGKGVVTHLIELDLLDRPYAPRNVVVTQSGDVWVEVTWSMVTPSPASTTVFYTVTATDPSGGVVSSPAIVDKTTAVLSGLVPNTQYNVVVTATAVSGSIQVEGISSQPDSAITNITVPKLQCLKVSPTSSGGLRVGWSFVHTGGLNLSSVLILYSINGEQDKNVVTHKEMGVDANGRPTSVTVGNVTAGWTYAFSVFASNRLGNSSTDCPYFTPSLGVPQVPGIIQTKSSGGSVVLGVSTQASGAPPSGWVEFVVRAEQVTGKEQLWFRQEAVGYSNGEEIELRLSGFPMGEEEEESTYRLFVSCQNEFGMSNESEPASVTINFSSFPGVLISGASAGGAALLVIVTVLLVLALCLCKRKRLKNRRIIHIHQPSRIEAPNAVPSVNLDAEEEGFVPDSFENNQYESVREVHQIHTNSATSSRVDALNRANVEGMCPSGTQHHNVHLRQKSGSSFSSGTASEITHDRYPMVTPVVAAMVTQPQTNGLSRIVHSGYESPKRELGISNPQHRPYAVNPLAGYSATPQQSDCRNFSPSLRQSFKSGGPSSAMDLRLSNRQVFQETVSYHNSSNGEISKLSGLSRQSSIAGTYHYSSSDV